MLIVFMTQVNFLNQILRNSSIYGDLTRTFPSKGTIMIPANRLLVMTAHQWGIEDSYHESNFPGKLVRDLLPSNFNGT